MSDTEKSAVKKVTDAVTKDLPKLVTENKGAAVGALIGYFFADALKDKEGVVTAVLGGLVGHAVDNNKKKDLF
jgi:uncharacterized protein YcfJ